MHDGQSLLKPAEPDTGDSIVGRGLRTYVRAVQYQLVSDSPLMHNNE